MRPAGPCIGPRSEPLAEADEQQVDLEGADLGAEGRRSASMPRISKASIVMRASFIASYRA
jgi:hypothetical protein